MRTPMSIVKGGSGGGRSRPLRSDYGPQGDDAFSAASAMRPTTINSAWILADIVHLLSQMEDWAATQSG